MIAAVRVFGHAQRRTTEARRQGKGRTDEMRGQRLRSRKSFENGVEAVCGQSTVAIGDRRRWIGVCEGIRKVWLRDGSFLASAAKIGRHTAKW